MASPILKFSCGCVGVSLDRPSKIADHVDVWLLQACDGDGNSDSDLISSIRAMPSKRVAAGVPLSPTYTEVFVRAVGNLFYDGKSMRDLAATIKNVRSEGAQKLSEEFDLAVVTEAASIAQLKEEHG